MMLIVLKALYAFSVDIGCLYVGHKLPVDQFGQSTSAIVM